MFLGCTSLTSVPAVLPATTLANNCYNGMFDTCTSLTSAPELPATTLADSCYYYMFAECSSLTSAPELPATTLAGDCYDSMFYGCTSLTSAPTLPATTLASYCYNGMFAECSSLTSAPELPATTLANRCYQYMFRNCTGLTSAPELPAATLSNYCYNNMFDGCTNLNYIKCLATNISATDCTYNWVNGVSSTGTFVKSPGITENDWGRGKNGIPGNWTVENNVLLNLVLWIDDYPMNGNDSYNPEDEDPDFIESFYETEYSSFNDYVRNDLLEDTDNYKGANPFYYIDEMEYEGKTYYLLAYGGRDGDGSNVKYALTEYDDYNTLYNMSIENNTSNRNCPIYTFLDQDMEETYVPDYDDIHYVLLKVEEIE